MYASTINQSWASPMDGQDEMNDLLTHRIDSNVKVTFGGIAINGSMHMNDEYGADGSTMTDTWTIFGDPSLIVRNTTPQVIVPEYAAALPIGSTTLDISLDANGTKVCMIKDSVLVASGIISEGMVSLDISSVVIPGEADIVIVGQQVETFIGEFMFIVPSGPYLVSQNYTISNDDNADSIAGYGETFNLNLSLKNVGVEVAEQVAISITTSNEYVESISLNSNVVLGDVNVEETKKSTNSFLIKLKNNVPDQHHITFNAVAKANNYEGEWAYNIALVANAPTLGLQSVTYNDDFEGNVVNNLIEAGETGEILCTIANVGHANIDQLNAVLINVNNDAAIVSNISSLSDITISDEGIAQLVFNITANADIYPGTIFPMQIDINAGEYEFKNEFDLQVGVMPDVIIGEVDEISSCFGFFYDSGKDEAYENNENKVTTIMPLIDGNKIEMTFEEFSIESGYDYLHVYDGNNTDENEIEGSPFSGTDIPEVILATNETGALTFKFTSDSYANDNGWKATFECISMDMPCVNVVQPQNNETLDYNFTTISWQPIEDAVVYHVYYGESIDTKPSASISDTSFIVENLNENTAYKFKVIPESASGDQPQECAIYTFTSGSTALLMHTGVVAVGNGYFFDNGGLDDYTLNAGDTLTMIPVIDGKAVAVNFEEFALEQGVDKLYIYNGMEVSESTLIGMYDQSNPSLIGNDGSVVASIEGGALTFVFESDSKISASGWKASIELVELVGISESFTHSVSIHPNPVVSVLTVSADAEFEISVLDVSGKILYQNIGQERYELNMDAYKSGLYFVQIIDQNGQIYIRKVVRSED